MRAVYQPAYGEFEIREVETPLPASDQILVRTRAASVNMYDWHLSSGLPYLLVRPQSGWRAPKSPIPGADLAGVVEQVGPEVTRFRPGDEVLGMMKIGAFAEYACDTEANFVRKPAGIGFEEAAAIPMAGLTALQGLRDTGRIEGGDKVLIVGASGGVGTFAVQIAKTFGAEVTAVCSTAKVEQARSLGADRIIDYTKTDFIDGTRYDLIFDAPAHTPWSRLTKALTANAVYAFVGGPKHRWLGPIRHLGMLKLASAFDSQTVKVVPAHMDVDDLELLAKQVESGEIMPVIEKVVSLEEAGAAIAYIGEGHAHGKVVITF